MARPLLSPRPRRFARRRDHRRRSWDDLAVGSRLVIVCRAKIGEPAIDGRTTSRHALHPAPAFAGLSPLLHRNKADVFPACAHGRPDIKSPAVVLDPNEEASSIILEGYGDPGGSAVLASVRESFLRDAVGDRTHVRRWFARKTVFENVVRRPGRSPHPVEEEAQGSLQTIGFHDVGMQLEREAAKATDRLGDPLPHVCEIVELPERRVLPPHRLQPRQNGEQVLKCVVVDPLGDAPSLLFLCRDNSREKFSTLPMGESELLEASSLSVLSLLPGCDIQLDTLIPRGFPGVIAREHGGDVVHHTTRPSRATIRYSSMNGSPASTLRAVSSSTSARSSGWRRSIHSCGFSIHSAGRNPSTPSICGLTYSSAIRSKPPAMPQMYTMAGICSRSVRYVDSRSRVSSSLSGAIVGVPFHASVPARHHGRTEAVKDQHRSMMQREVAMLVARCGNEPLSRPQMTSRPRAPDRAKPFGPRPMPERRPGERRLVR
jgi:hypothetical protein